MPAAYPGERGAAYQAFVERYQAAYGEEPDNEAVQGYDLANLILKNYSGDNAAPVSYTHLDVYKRQGNDLDITTGTACDLLVVIKEQKAYELLLGS